MADLIAKSPMADLLPMQIGTVQIAEVVIEQAWLVAPYKGQATAVSTALKAAIGVNLPAPNAVSAKGGVMALWTGGNQVLVIGATLPDLNDQAAVTDQADGLAVARVSGTGVEAVLARLVPIDLRLPGFGVGQTARTLVGHMPCSVTRIDDQTIDVMVMRSMAATLVHDLTRAATGVAGR